jgi:hypothetical protein
MIQIAFVCIMLNRIKISMKIKQFLSLPNNMIYLFVLSKSSAFNSIFEINVS